MTLIAANRGRCPTAATRGSVVRLLGMSLCSALILTACKLPSSDTAKETGSPAYVDVVNYNHQNGYVFSLEDLTVPSAPAIGGGIIERLAGGGSIGCCITLPQAWHEGLRVRLIWQITTTEQTFEKHERELEIPAYQSPGNLYVVFGPDQQPELIVSRVEPGHPDWPGTIKQKPWDYCVAQHGRKVCKAAQPKTFSLDEIEGICIKLHDSKEIDAEHLCAGATQSCIDAYEDSQMCNKIVWQKGIQQ